MFDYSIQLFYSTFLATKNCFGMEWKQQVIKGAVRCLEKLRRLINVMQQAIAKILAKEQGRLDTCAQEGAFYSVKYEPFWIPCLYVLSGHILPKSQKRTNIFPLIVEISPLLLKFLHLDLRSTAYLDLICTHPIYHHEISSIANTYNALRPLHGIGQKKYKANLARRDGGRVPIVGALYRIQLE